MRVLPRGCAAPGRALLVRGTMGEQKAVIKDTDMPAEMQQLAVQCAVRSLEELSPERSAAAELLRASGAYFGRKFSSLKVPLSR